MSDESYIPWEEALNKLLFDSIKNFDIFNPLNDGIEYLEMLDNIEELIKNIDDSREQLKAVITVQILYELGMVLLPLQTNEKRENIKTRRNNFYESVNVTIEDTNESFDPGYTIPPDISIIKECLNGDRKDLRNMCESLTSFASLQNYQPEFGFPEIVTFFGKDIYQNTSNIGVIDLFTVLLSFIPPKPFLPFHLVFSIAAIFEVALKNRIKDVGIWGDYLTFITEQIIRLGLYMKGKESEYKEDINDNVIKNGMDNKLVSDIIFEICENIFKRAINSTHGAVRPICLFVKAKECIMTKFGADISSNSLSQKDAINIFVNYLLPEMKLFTKYPDRPELFRCAFGLIIRSISDESLETDRTTLIAGIAFRVCYEFIAYFEEKNTDINLSRKWTDLFFDAIELLEMLEFYYEARTLLLQALEKKNQQLHLVSRSKRFGELFIRCQMSPLIRGETDAGKGILDFLQIKNNSINIEELGNYVLKYKCDIEDDEEKWKLDPKKLILSSFDYTKFTFCLADTYKQVGKKGIEQHLFNSIDIYISSSWKKNLSFSKDLLLPPTIKYIYKYMRYLTRCSNFITEKYRDNHSVSCVIVTPNDKYDFRKYNRKEEKKASEIENEQLYNKKTPLDKDEPKKIKTNDDFLTFIKGNDNQE